ncbi:MAG: diguanylate cyclase [Oliverpabstia sp.]|nr:diguanylate cyclase [Oliverpabstia sp.]
MERIRKEKYIIMVFLAIIGVFFIAVTLVGFNEKIQKRMYDLQMDSMKELSMQGSAVVEKNLESLTNTLYGLAEYMSRESIQKEENIKRLQEFLDKRKLVGFQRLGLADAQGNARVTNGDTLNIADREYFQQCIRYKREVLEVRDSNLVNKRVIILGVPVMGLKNKNEVIGVLYGVLEQDNLRIYENTILENEEQFIQIIDTEGNYILKEETSLLGKRKNIYEGIRQMNSSSSVGEIQRKLSNEESVFVEVWTEENEEILFFSPLKFNNWCVVTIMNKDKVLSATDFILDKDVYLLTVKIVGVLLILGIVILYYFYQEKKWTQEYNKQLLLNEQVFKIASNKAEVMLAIYDLKSKRIRFINNEVLAIGLPQQIDNAPVEIKKYLFGDKELEQKMEWIFNNLSLVSENRTINLKMNVNGKKRYLKIQFFGVTDEAGELSQSVGMVEDITETKQLRKEANTDQLTGLYNRRCSVEKIRECLVKPLGVDDTVHVCMIMDLDYFKTLNDTLGHQVGDKALQDVAHILTQHFREYDILGRLGGDEFLVFVKNIPEKVVSKNIESLLHKLHLTYGTESQQVTISASAGAVLVRKPGYDFKELYHRADQALYEVKHEKRGEYKIVDMQ